MRCVSFVVSVALLACCGQQADQQYRKRPLSAEKGPPVEAQPQLSYSAPPSDEVRRIATAEDLCAQLRRDPETKDSSTPQLGGVRAPMEFLPGLAELKTTPADAQIGQRLLGRSCAGLPEVWAVRTTALSGYDPSGEALLALSYPVLITLKDGRKAFIAAASEGSSHAASGFPVAAILGPKEKLVALGGGGTWGDVGDISVPSVQPLGAFHIWIQGGGMWQGYVQGWASIADFTTDTPVDVGNFPTDAFFPCEEVAQGTPRLRCRGAKEYSLSSITYGLGGADELSLRWEMREWDEVGSWEHSRKIRQRQSTFEAIYEMRGGRYVLVRGAEPPRV